MDEAVRVGMYVGGESGCVDVAFAMTDWKQQLLLVTVRADVMLRELDRI